LGLHLRTKEKLMDPAVARKVLPDGSIVMADHPLVGDGTQQVLLSHVAVLYLMRIFFGHQKKHPTPKPKSRSKRKQQPGGGPHKGGANAKASPGGAGGLAKVGAKKTTANVFTAKDAAQSLFLNFYLSTIEELLHTEETVADRSFKLERHGVNEVDRKAERLLTVHQFLEHQVFLLTEYILD
jgi:hypothetical protein